MPHKICLVILRSDFLDVIEKRTFTRQEDAKRRPHHKSKVTNAVAYIKRELKGIELKLRHWIKPWNTVIVIEEPL